MSDTTTTTPPGVIETQPDPKHFFDGVTLGEEAAALVINKLNEVKALLPVLPNLTPLERRRKAKLGTKTRGFVEGAFETVRKDPGVLPASLSVGALDQQHQLYRSLSLIETHVADLAAKLSDGLLVSGNWNYQAALSIYAMFKTPLARAKMPDQQAFLRQRFARKKKGQSKDTVASK
jgi:hypothetical protein